MKSCITKFISIIASVVCLVAWWTFVPSAMAQTPAAAPAATPRPTGVLVVNYMKVKGDIVGMQRDLWMPVHQESVKTGKMAGWSSWSVRFAGTNSEYDFITVDSFKNWADLEKTPWTAETWAKLHPDKKLAEISQRTNAARDIVRRDMLRPLAMTDVGTSDIRAKYLVVDFYKTTPDKAQAYVQLERETFLPIHQALVKQGKLVLWHLYGVSGAGSESPYNYITVRGFAKWEDIPNAGTNTVLASVHPNLKPEELSRRAREARTLAKSQILTLVAEVPPMTVIAEK